LTCAVLITRDRGYADDVAHELFPRLKRNGDFCFGTKACAVEGVLHGGEFDGFTFCARSYA
jgi:hypothetical protein